MDFNHFVRARLSTRGLSIDPIEDSKASLDDLCRDFKDRVDAVNKSITSGIVTQRAPKKLPENIYGTNGDWETYSTPSRDARLKASVREIYNSFKEYLNPQDTDFEISYEGDDLKGELAQIFKEKTSSCKYQFSLSDGSNYQTNLSESLSRLFDLSFDPYQCIELRWGLTNTGTCDQDRDKWDWYRAQSSLRNQIDRDYSQFMGYDISGLERSGLGVSKKPEFDFENLLAP